MEIIEYNEKYDNDIKDLLVELQNYLVDIDDWHTQVMLPEYRDIMFEIDINKVKSQNGRIYLALKENNIIGLIIGVIAIKDEVDKLTNDCARTGEVLELVISNSMRGTGVGKLLLLKMEEYFKSNDCKRINIEVFGPNKKGLNFYIKNDYVVRDFVVSKNIK